MLHKKLPRKKHVREDGFLVELISKAYRDEPFNCVHSYLVTVEPKKTRAGHYHRKKDEWLCIVAGKAEIELIDVESKEREKILLDSGSEEYNIIYIPQKVAHIVRNPSIEEKAALIVFSREPEDREDTIKYSFTD